MVLSNNTLVLITGTSRGLGKALCEKFFNYHVVGINRQQVGITDIIMDLSCVNFDPAAIVHIIDGFERVVFINNAATIEPITPILNLHSFDYEYVTYLNFLNPAKLIQAIVSTNVPTIAINITSGAAFSANAQLALYSATKAALHRFVDIFSKEQEHNENVIHLANFDPGRMNTGMQKILLNEIGTTADLDGFSSPEVIAEQLFKLVENRLYE